MIKTIHGGGAWGSLSKDRHLWVTFDTGDSTVQRFRSERVATGTIVSASKHYEPFLWTYEMRRQRDR